MPRPEKVRTVEVLRDRFSNSRGIVLADFTGLTVAEVSELRRKCKSANVEYSVVKNTLARIAARQANLEVLVEHFRGPVAVATCIEESIVPVKVLDEFARRVEKISLKVGYLDGKLFMPKDLKVIASLPPREVMLGQVIGAIQSPLAGILWTVEGVLRNLVSIIDQLAQKRGSS